jgi:hypothetical protein
MQRATVDDYRPRPVAVAPEPLKQDLIDNEILESVPKTMKAKVQLLLKKMRLKYFLLLSTSLTNSTTLLP